MFFPHIHLTYWNTKVDTKGYFCGQATLLTKINDTRKNSIPF